MKKSLLIILLSASMTAFSQCIPGHSVGTSISNNTTGWLWGQSFTATCSGNLDYVEFISTGTGTVSAGTLTIYNGDNVTAVLHTQSHPAITVTTPGDPMRINITSPLAVTNGNQYTFEFQVNNVATLADWGNSYVGGISYQNGNTAGVDFAFNASISISTGVNNIISSEFNVYPNPAQNLLNINSKHKINKTTIYSVDGSLVNTYSNVNESIDISDLSKGMYLLLINTESGIIQHRFIKE